MMQSRLKLYQEGWRTSKQFIFPFPLKTLLSYAPAHSISLRNLADTFETELLGLSIEKVGMHFLLFSSH